MLKYYYPLFAAGETEVQKDLVTCPKSGSYGRAVVRSQESGCLSIAVSSSLGHSGCP